MCLIFADKGRAGEICATKEELQLLSQKLREELNMLEGTLDLQLLEPFMHLSYTAMRYQQSEQCSGKFDCLAKISKPIAVFFN